MASPSGILFISVLCASAAIIYSAAVHRKRPCSHLRACLDDFPMLVDLIEKDNAGALVTLTYKSLLDHVCSKASKLTKCLEENHCSVFQQYYIGRAVRDALAYICKDGREVLLTESGCFARDDFEWGIYQCSKAMRLETDIATLQIQIEMSDSSSFCQVFDNLLQCVRLNVQRTCSSKAADFTSAVFGNTIKTLANHIGCTITFS